MSLLTIVQGVCDEIGLPRPSAVSSSTDQLARQMFALANKELLETSKGKNWPALEQEHTFSTVVDQSEYDLPEDFRNILVNTVYNADQYYKIKGSVSAPDWQRRRNELLGSLDRMIFRISGDNTKFRISPTPEAVNELVFEYITKNFAIDESAVAVPKYVSDTDVSRIDEDVVQMGLKWRILKAKGMDYAEEHNEWELAVNREYAKRKARPDIIVGGSIYGDTVELTDGFVRPDGFGS